MTDRREQGFEDLERRARAAFDASVEALDAGARSRLNQARRRALQAVAPGSRAGRARRWSTWAPLGALAASVLAAALLLRGPLAVEPPPATVASHPAALAQEPLELLAAGEEFEMATADEELEFYEWIGLAAADVPNGQG
jgi:hypothetical protein